MSDRERQDGVDYSNELLSDIRDAVREQTAAIVRLAECIESLIVKVTK